MDKMRQWMMLTALGVVGIMAAGWFLLVSPQRAHAKDLQAQATAQQQSTASVQGQVNQLKQQQKDEPAQQRKLMKIATQIPDNPQLPVLIRELSTAAHQSGVSLVSLAPAQPSLVTAAAPAAPTSAGAAAPAAASPLAQIPISVQVTGSYFNIESFFQSVEHLDRAMLVTGFTLNPDNAGSSSNTATGATGGGTGAVGSAPGSLTAQVSAVVFESPVVAPAAGTVAQTPTTQAPATSTTTTAPGTQASAAPSAAPAQ